MPDLTYKTLETKLTAEPGERAVVAHISAAVVDRDGDVLLPSGIETDDFNKNPILMLSHADPDMTPSQWRGLPLGNVVGITTSSKHVRAKMTFVERNPSHPPNLEWVPDTIHWLYQKGTMRMFSVGFRIKDARPATQKDIDRFGDGARRVITRWPLIELSACPIGCNQDALTTAVSKSCLKEWAAECWKLSEPRRIVVAAPRKVPMLQPKKVKMA